jgi:hypothetical protein
VFVHSGIDAPAQLGTPNPADEQDAAPLPASLAGIAGTLTSRGYQTSRPVLGEIEVWA